MCQILKHVLLLFHSRNCCNSFVHFFSLSIMEKKRKKKKKPFKEGCIWGGTLGVEFLKISDPQPLCLQGCLFQECPIPRALPYTELPFNPQVNATVHCSFEGTITLSCKEKPAMHYLQRRTVQQG